MAVKVDTVTVRLVAVAGRVKTETTGAVVSGRVIDTAAESGAEILPAESLAKAYRVLLPCELKV